MGSARHSRQAGKFARHALQIHILPRVTNEFLQCSIENYNWDALQVGLLNVDGYYNSLLSFIDKAVEEEFISPGARSIIVLAPTPRELLQKLEVCVLSDKNYHYFMHRLSLYLYFCTSLRNQSTNGTAELKHRL
jgi:hypothetical protein